MNNPESKSKIPGLVLTASISLGVLSILIGLVLLADNFAEASAQFFLASSIIFGLLANALFRK